MNPETSRVVLLHLCARVAQCGVVAVAGNVHTPHVEAGIAVGHPVGESKAHSPALAQPGHDGARAPVTGQTTDRPEQWVAVRREREGPVDDLLDTCLSEYREVLEANVE